MSTITNIDTRYLGIWMQQYAGEWFLMSATGCEQHMGQIQPTDTQVEAFRNELLGIAHSL